MTLTAEQLGKPLIVKKRIQETPEAVSLVLDIPTELKSSFHFQAGQFVTFFLKIEGETLARSYSISSSPVADSDFKITVKKVPGGRGSTYLCQQLKEGDTLLTTPPAGQFFKPTLATGGTHYFLFAAGSGITPVYSILKTVLSASPLNLVTMVFCNRNEDSIIYREELQKWSEQYPSQLRLIHTLTKPSDSWKGRKGRIESQFVKEILQNNSEWKQSPTTKPSAQEHYLCGPVDFMNSIRTVLAQQNVPASSIHIESFGVELHKPTHTVPDSWTLIGPGSATSGESPEKIIALLDGKTIEIPAKKGQNILEALLESGAQPPYSCMDGACMACLGKVIEGQVYQEDPGILIEDNIRNCETLTCQAKPLTRIVRVSYDNL
jgi:ring-1,2-phenylacetyl-CoA epoxidase subunit PaaE